MKRGTIIVAAVLVAVATMAAKGCGTSTTKGSTAPTAATAPTPTAATTPPTAPPTTHPAPPTAPPTTLTLSEQNAIQAAQNYLSMGEGFSRTGLIQQLSSSAGDGYTQGVATFAVDELKVNWNAQAVLAAKAYLQTSTFSCTELVQQLDSAAGSQFTVAQAEYGAKQVGIC